MTSAASQADPLASVPRMMPALPTSASPRCASALSRLAPPNVVRTSAAKLPNTANRATWMLPMTSKDSQSMTGTTTVARRARSAAAADQVGSSDLAVRWAGPVAG